MDRTFHELSSYSRENDDIEISDAFHIGDSLTWNDVLLERRIVILSEAGSGKTSEIYNVANHQRSLGRYSFFLRLEHLAEDFELSFEVGTLAEFEEWQASLEEAWIFLDSVDEARLRSPSDFEKAIKRLGQKLKSSKERAHIVITSRPYAWRPKTDLIVCERYLSVGLSNSSTTIAGPPVSKSDPIEKVYEPDEPNDKPLIKILVIDELSHSQIVKFADEIGVSNSKEFLNAVERADAWHFTTRPQDLIELTEFWINEGRIGSKLELIQNSIQRRLSERDQSRAESASISIADARLGAQMLAAASTLAAEANIQIQDGAPLSSKSIAVPSVLREWDDNKRNALLSRPIFDEAIYGTVRFHHRSVREYLTAEWFAELLSRNTSTRSVYDILFKSQYGLFVIPPRIRPILPWLALLNDGVRIHLENNFPEVLLEGGAPSELPLSTRRTVLHDVCKKMSEGKYLRGQSDLEMAQRFARCDLFDDMQKLLGFYRHNDDVIAFLLRMIWLGEISGLSSETIRVAISSSYSKYTRVLAIRAISAIGSKEDLAQIKKALSDDQDKIERTIFSEVVASDLSEARQLHWLLQMFPKVISKDRYVSDDLDHTIAAAIDKADLSDLPDFIVGLSAHLRSEPSVEKKFCDVSREYYWLLPYMFFSIKRLIEARNHFCLEEPSLSAISMLSDANFYQNDGVAAELRQLVPEWQELNNAAFWHDIEAARSEDHSSKQRVTHFQSARPFLRFWQFNENNFNYLLEQICKQPLLDNKLVALSLAFRLYADHGRPRKWLNALKKAATPDTELVDHLNQFLKPPPASEAEKKLRRQEAQWQKKSEQRKEKEEKYRHEWKEYLEKHIDDVTNTSCVRTGEVSNAQYYIHERMRELEPSHNKWSSLNLIPLREEFGTRIVAAFREGALLFWRYHKPKIRSEGAPANRTTFYTIFGLTGLSLEFETAPEQIVHLSKNEVDIACRYASHELNGFPKWFPHLFKAYPEQVSDFLLREIFYELRSAKKNSCSYYILSDVQWSGEWAWEHLAPHILEYLTNSEPKNFDQLCQLISILQRSSISDETLAELARSKLSKLRRPKHLAAWFSVLVGTSPSDGITKLTYYLERKTDEQASELVMRFLVNLMGKLRSPGLSARKSYLQSDTLKSLYFLVIRFIRFEDDINRAGRGAYSPTLRDDAQEARDRIFTLLTEQSGKSAFIALNDIAVQNPERPWLKGYVINRAIKDSEMAPWTCDQVLQFHNNLDLTPKDHRELASLTKLRLEDLKHHLEHGDDSIANVLIRADQETELRNFIGHELRRFSNGRYSVTQEEEMADAKRPDLRVTGNGFDAPVPIELKIADNWSGQQLFERLENQLCRSYLRDSRSKYGFFALIYRGEKSGWDVPNSESRCDFNALIQCLRNRWIEISKNFSYVEDIHIVGLDLTARKTLPQ
ncbi:NACHT domain-containing protein [Ponticaulis koreensis]|uniref:hypothetical protein n=1 Tax=Ponticaulis koreensis TaxID=1123045 RepID=UPI0012DF11C5|nr:hypothetical protein [Ponticaulis koreensis]